jgi:tRNA-dihydrouridine synthase
MFREQGVDGAMIGRGAMGNPWVLGQIAARLRGEPDPPRRRLMSGSTSCFATRR